MKLKVIFNDWQEGFESVEDIEIKENSISSISSDYDGGRFHLFINSTEVFGTMTASHDVSCEVQIIKG